jgi:putative membrane protein
MTFLAPFYLWLKAFHVIAVISWMAGLLYLPRLFVYHAEAGADNERAEMLKVMERRLYRFIMTPAMILSWLLGLILAGLAVGFEAGAIWFVLKFLFVIALTGIHGFLGRQVKVFGDDANQRPARFFRLLNEVPTLIMICVVILVIVKPF